MGTYFNLPFTSGKDSMKNDFYGDGVKISVPPTILYSVTALMDDIDDIITTDFKNSGDLIYQVGETYNELGGSEFYKLFGYLGKNNPLVRFDKAKDLYNKFIISSEKKLIESSHDVSDGGMLVALVEKSFGSFNLGFDVDISNIEISCDYNIEKNIIKLFSESNSRFIVTVKEENKDIFEEIFKSRVFYLGKVTDNKKVRVFDGEKLLIDIDKSVLLNCWEK
jgi:phosphoribosylformylglycinamidine synthase